jgi:hypothetical protein
MVVVEELNDDSNELPTALPDGTRSRPAAAGTGAKAKAGDKTAAARTQVDKNDEMEASSDKQKQRAESNVFINVYDITPRLNKMFRCCCCSAWGIYHTGVEVYGREFAFGGHDASTTGVFCAKPRAIEGARFREQVPIGHTKLDPTSLRRQIAALATDWSGNSYELFTRNCNHFSSALCEDLTGETAPRYVNRCAQSSVIRCIFNTCVKPIVRCLDRCSFFTGGCVTYADEEEQDEGGAEYCISGARGMNAVLVEAASQQKEHANEYFRAGDYGQAASMYMQALSLIQALSRLQVDLDDDRAVMKQAAEVCRALLLNIAACNLKAQDWHRAILCCNQVLQFHPQNAKAYFRRGIGLSKTGKLDEALKDLQQALSLTDQSDEATCQHIEREIETVSRQIRRDQCVD